MASLGGVPTANAWCIGISGINIGEGCTTELGTFALGIGDETTATAGGFLTGATIDQTDRVGQEIQRPVRPRPCSDRVLPPKVGIPAVGCPHGKGTYRLWCKDGGAWCDYDIVGEKSYGATIRELLPPDWSGDGIEVTRDFELVPEPDNPYDRWAIAVQADGRTVGYLAREDAPAWAGVVRRVPASGHTPVVPGRVYAFYTHDWDNWDGDGDPPKEFAATVQLKLGDPNTALPINDPPAVPHTLIPRSSIVQVTKEDQHADALLNFVPASGYGLLFATLHERDASRGGVARSVVEVRIDDECVGQLTPQTSQRFLPLIRHLDGRGLATACWADITGSSVAAEVRIDGVKANEADASVLDGAPVVGQRLIPALEDPLSYDLTGAIAGEAQPTAGYAPDRGLRTGSETTVVPPPLPPAGCYEDPGYPQYIRYWDGTAWTEHTAPRSR